MTTHDEERRDATPTEVGDVETAGETTAAATTAGEDASQQPPVGADTLVEVSDKPTATEEA